MFDTDGKMDQCLAKMNGAEQTKIDNVFHISQFGNDVVLTISKGKFTI
jgi:hypothetical protein